MRKPIEASGYENGAIVPTVGVDDLSEEDLSSGIANQREPDLATKLIDHWGFTAGEAAEFEQFIESCADSISRADKIEFVSNVITVLMEAERPRMTAYMLCSLFNLNALLGLSDSQIAAKFGVSRQDYDQAQERLRKKLGIDPVITRNNKQNPEIYALTNHRRKKKCLPSLNSSNSRTTPSQPKPASNSRPA